jgi:hypothetical protein
VPLDRPRRLAAEDDSFRDRLPVFASRGFLAAKNEEHGWIASSDFVIPYIVDRRSIFRRVVYTNQPIALDGGGVEAEIAFLEGAGEVCRREIGVDFVAMGQANAVFRGVPRDAVSIVWGTYVADLSGDADALMARIQPRTRSKIRQAGRAGVVAEATRDIDRVHSLLHATMDRQRLPFTPAKEFLSRLAANLADELLLFVATLEGEDQGAIVVPFNRHGGYYYYGGSIESPHAGALQYLHFEAMRRLQRLGVPRYDLMGARLQLEKDSKLLGVQRFKRQLGGELETGFAFRQVFRPVRFRLFNAAAAGYLRLQGKTWPGDPIDQVRKLLRRGEYEPAP